MLNNTSKPFIVLKSRCPECGGKLILWRRPSRYQGILECINEACGFSDACEHENVHEEMVEPWPSGPEDNPIERPVYVCDDCDMTVEDRDPVLDRLEAAYD